jgi:hypothetical protein
MKLDDIQEINRSCIVAFMLNRWNGISSSSLRIKIRITIHNFSFWIFWFSMLFFNGPCWNYRPLFCALRSSIYFGIKVLIGCNCLSLWRYEVLFTKCTPKARRWEESPHTDIIVCTVKWFIRTTNIPGDETFVLFPYYNIKSDYFSFSYDGIRTKQWSRVHPLL